MKMFIKDAKNFIGKEVKIRGWVYNLRSSGSIAFFQIRDGSGFMQAVLVKNDVSEEKWEESKNITIETSIILTGEITKHPKKEDVFELQVKDFEIVQISEEYPIGKKEHGPAFLLDNRHLWLRSNKQWAIQSVRDCLIRGTYEFFHKEGS
jgi:asparaginyl-tRNA synthetase